MDLAPKTIHHSLLVILRREEYFFEDLRASGLAFWGQVRPRKLAELRGRGLGLAAQFLASFLALVRSDVRALARLVRARGLTSVFRSIYNIVGRGGPLFWFSFSPPVIGSTNSAESEVRSKPIE